MNDNIHPGGPSLAAFLDRIGLPAVAQERVIEIDRTLAKELESDSLDADRCASLVFEAADLIADCDPPCFDWAGFDFDEPDWGTE
jgi:hypothetical protein